MIENRVPDLVARKFGDSTVNLSEVQRATGLTYSTVLRWMKRQVDRVDFPTLETWCKYLGVQPGDLLVYVPDTKKPGIGNSTEYARFSVGA